MPNLLSDKSFSNIGLLSNSTDVISLSKIALNKYFVISSFPIYPIFFRKHNRFLGLIFYFL